MDQTRFGASANIWLQKKTGLRWFQTPHGREPHCRWIGNTLDRNSPKWVQIGVFAMKKFLKFFLRDERGAAAAEYALILAVVAGGIAIAATALGDAISDAIETVTTEISGSGTGTGGGTGTV